MTADPVLQADGMCRGNRVQLGTWPSVENYSGGSKPIKSAFFVSTSMRVQNHGFVGLSGQNITIKLMPTVRPVGGRDVGGLSAASGPLQGQTGS